MFVLDTDASNFAVGAELSQVQDGEIRTIAYASNILLPAQRKYCTTRKELLAVVKFTDQFRHFLLGRPFLVRTDHNSLVWLYSFRRLEGQLARWQEQLAQFQLTIIHRAGGKHCNADGLSRLPSDLPECDCYTAGRDPKSLPCQGCDYGTKAHEKWNRFCEDIDDVVPLAVRNVSILEETSSTPETQNQSQNSILDSTVDLDPPPEFPSLSQDLVSEAELIRSNYLPVFFHVELRDLQLADPDINLVIQWLEREEPPLNDVLFLSSPATKLMWIHRMQLRMIQGVLYYLWECPPDQRMCLVVPSVLREFVLTCCHDHKTAGHLGENKTLARTRRSFWWPHMSDDCTMHTKKCLICGKNKGTSNPPRAGLRKHHSGYPMERVHIDVLGPFPISKLGNKYILVMVDQFTKWVDCAAIPEQSAETVALKFFDYFMSPIGIPMEIHSDQGSNFESQLFQAFCKCFQIAKTRTTPYHPSSNGQVERFNRTLLPMIRSYIEGKQNLWDKDLSLLVFSLHSTVNRQTGFTPNHLMLGREVFQPVDLALGTASVNSDRYTPTDWAKTIKNNLIEAHRITREHLRSTQMRQKRDYDLRKLKEIAYSPGDLVWKLYQVRKKGRSFK